MFRPVPMMRLSVVILEKDERVVLRDLGQRGVVQLRHTRAGPDTAPLDPPDRGRELTRCEYLLARIEDLRRSLEIPGLTGEPAETPEMTLDQIERDLHIWEERANDLFKHRQSLQRRSGDLTAVWEQVSSYRGLEIPLDQIGQFSFLHFVMGSLPQENLEKLQETVGEDVVLIPLSPQERRQPVIALTSRQGRVALESALQQAGFDQGLFPAVRGATVDALSEETHRERDQVAGELKQLNEEKKELAAEAIQPLAKMEKLVSLERRLLEAEQNFPRTEASVLLSGWIPAGDAPALEERLREITGGRCAIEATPPESRPLDPIPILLRHPRLFRPFEMLVSAYGLPEYQELEPTVFVAISYMLMFGMMFGDAGHGAVLAIGGLIALLSGRTPKTRDLGLLLLLGGLSSIGFGVVYGSYFGITQAKKYAFWHDPLEGNPIGLMYASIGIGIVMISLGLILNIINRFRRGDVGGGFLDKFGVVGALFYWGVLALVGKYAAIQSWGLVNMAFILFLVLPITAWILKEPVTYALGRHAGHPTESGGMFAAVTESLVGTFEAVLAYFANTISFVRLAAYAMSHAALLMAAFVMAAEVERFSPGGSLLGILVIIFGNLVAIILEGIVASVQALRLEYYEFFGKFFSGSGQPFKPFCFNAEGQGAARQRSGL